MTSPLVNLSRGAGQIDQASIVIESSESHKNPLNPPAAPGDSLSLFSEGETPAASEDPAEDPASVRAAIQTSLPAEKSVTLGAIEAEWKAMPPEGRDRYRPEAVRQLQAKGYASPPEKMVEPTMFKLFWVERKGLIQR